MCFLIKYLSVGHAWFWFTNSVDLTLSRIIFAPANEWAQEFLVFDPDAEAHSFTTSPSATLALGSMSTTVFSLRPPCQRICQQTLRLHLKF